MLVLLLYASSLFEYGSICAGRWPDSALAAQSMGAWWLSTRIINERKTEQPTSKRLRDSRQKGDVAYSKDFTQTLLIMSIFGYLLANSGRIIESLGEMILLPGTLLRINFQDAANTLVLELLTSATWVILPFLESCWASAFLPMPCRWVFCLPLKSSSPRAKSSTS